mgnify:CR=1 FL=1
MNQTLSFTLRMLRRDARAGELHLLIVALIIAVAALTAVGFFTDRVRQGLQLEANQLLGADLLLVSDHPWRPELAEVARRVQAQLRPGDLAARLGGYEFAVVMAPVATLPDAEAMAARLGQAIAAPLRLASGGELHPAASIGVALFPQQGSDMEALLRAADVAMYHVKGRCRRAGTDTPARR